MADQISDEDAIKRLLHIVDMAGDGSRARGLEMVRELLIGRRNAGIFYRFVVWAGGSLLAALIFGRQIVETVGFLFGMKFGAR